jgi:hypothetical protein
MRHRRTEDLLRSAFIEDVLRDLADAAALVGMLAGRRAISGA